MRRRFTVRKQSSGYAHSITFYVYDTLRKGRVSVQAMSREQARASADELNIGEMVLPYEQDPRPYQVRWAEAEKAFRAEESARCNKQS